MAKTRHWERHRTAAYRLAPRRGARRERRHRLDREPAARRRGRGREPRQRADRGLAGLVAGAMSMAAGEYVSVHSQADTEAADLERERRELETDNESEHNELTAIYIGRGLDAHLARQVADATHGARRARRARSRRARHPAALRARPIQAALASAAALRSARRCRLRSPQPPAHEHGIPLIAACRSCSLAVLGGIAARAGGASVATGALRVTFWGALAMAITAAVGHFVGTAG